MRVSFDFTRILFHIPSTACTISRTLKVIYVAKLKVNKKHSIRAMGVYWKTFTGLDSQKNPKYSILNGPIIYLDLSCCFELTRTHLYTNSTFIFTVADPEGIQAVRLSPVFKYPMKMK